MSPNSPHGSPKGERSQVSSDKVHAAQRGETRGEPKKKSGGFSTLVHNKEDTYVPPSGPYMKQRGQS